MGYKAKVTFILLGLVTFNLTSAQNQCRTPRGQNGQCINIKRCPELIQILTSVPLNQQSINYLRSSQCGYENRDPKVCCAINTSSTIRPLASSNLLPEDCGRDLSNRIVGGTVTELDEFPWMALLEYRKPTGKTTACGGALISKRYVLTAAHCIKGRAVPKSWKLIGVRLGEYNTQTERDCISDGLDGQVCADPHLTVSVEEQIPHEGYITGENGELNDIALLRLARDVNFSNFVKPICLPSTQGLNQHFQVAGWGQTENKSESQVKMKVTVRLADKVSCAQRYMGYNITLHDEQICAGGETGKDSCRGDSGGPLMQQEKRNDGSVRWSSAGVVSFGPSPCGMKNWPGVYTKVYDYIPWIVSKIKP